jgi:amylo-alpha-1,6-glucosidase/glycogen debranching enzyme-like protein
VRQVEARPDKANPAALPRCPLEWGSEDLDSAGRPSLEWIETDGLGGFACGSAEGVRRRYHGWYAPPQPVTKKTPVVAGCEEYAWCDGETLPLWDESAQAPGEERGHPLVRFALDPFPTWRYETGKVAIERSLCLVRGRPIAIARYANRGARSVGLSARPLLRARSEPPGGPAAADSDSRVALRGEASWLSSLPGEAHLYLRGAGGKATREPGFAAEALVPEPAGRAGLWSPVAWDWVLAPGQEAFLVISPEEVSTDPAQLLESERERRQAFNRTDDPLFDELARRSEIFLVDGDTRYGSIVPGFPESGEFARDSMISLPGLTLACGHYAGAARVISAAAARLSAALTSGEEDMPGVPADFSSSDAPLWFVLAVEWFTRLRRHPARPTPLLGSVRGVLSAYRHGIVPGVSVGPDGLVSGVLEGQALTWMNATLDGKLVTPRYGRAVEVNALWHAALKAAARLERLAEENSRARELESEAWHVARRFNEIFWFSEGDFLYDVVGPDGSDPSLRPNQIFAVSLSEELLPPHRARAVYWVARSRLLTPFGLRTLDPRDPNYRARCGDSDSPRERALSLHQGAAWPWLLGAFADAHFRVLGRTRETQRSMQDWLQNLRLHVREAGAGSISEVFDAEDPQSPRGRFADARSVGEISRILYAHLKGN